MHTDAVQNEIGDLFELYNSIAQFLVFSAKLLNLQLVCFFPLLERLKISFAVALCTITYCSVQIAKKGE